VINIHQSAFLRVRGTLDSVLVANETLDIIKKKKKRGCIGESGFLENI